MNHNSSQSTPQVFSIIRHHQCLPTTVHSEVSEHYLTKTIRTFQGEQLQFKCKHCPLITDTKEAMWKHKSREHLQIIDELYQKLINCQNEN